VIIVADNSFSFAIDIGAGHGTKIALCIDGKFDEECTFPVTEYGSDFSSFSGNLAKALESLAQNAGKSLSGLKSIGIACAGILSSDGGFSLVHNISFLNGNNLKTHLESHFDVPAAIENDADAGGIAEWSVLRMELIYWVFGGGWGGSWISGDGEIMYPSYDWDGDDQKLHYTSEPGYAIPLDKNVLESLFSEVHASYDRFEDVVRKEPDFREYTLTGPDGNTDTLRAETILSGPGRLRLFKTLTGENGVYKRFLDVDEQDKITNPSLAGKYLDKLSGMRVEGAVSTDRLFGKILARAADILLNQAADNGMPPNLPICLGGKPSYALPYFGPSAQRALARLGILNYLRPSVIDDRGSNANLVGASVLAERAASNG